MATEAKLRQLADKGCPVYYFYSSERYLVRQAVAAAVRMLSADSDEDATILGNAAPEIEQPSWRRAPSPFLAPGVWWCCRRSTLQLTVTRDLEELNSTLSSLENAVVVLGSVFELERSKLQNRQARKS